jgi:hypothetical protein
MQTLMLALLCLVGFWPATQQPAGWSEFTSLDGGFQAAMPNEPRTTRFAIETEDGTLQTHLVSASDTSLNEFLVSWTEHPEKSVEQRATEKTFNRMRDALIKQKGGKLLSETTASQEGYPARTINFATAEGRFVRVTFCFVKNRTYQVLAETNDSDSATFARFFDSFKLLPAGLL